VWIGMPHRVGVRGSLQRFDVLQIDVLSFSCGTVLDKEPAWDVA
jgi:hypothetical protein